MGSGSCAAQGVPVKVDDPRWCGQVRAAGRRSGVRARGPGGGARGKRQRARPAPPGPRRVGWVRAARPAAPGRVQLRDPGVPAPMTAWSSTAAMIAAWRARLRLSHGA